MENMMQVPDSNIIIIIGLMITYRLIIMTSIYKSIMPGCVVRQHGLLGVSELRIMIHLQRLNSPL